MAYKFDEEQWKKLIEELVMKFEQGALIPHALLRKMFGIENPDFDDFEDQEDFIEALQMLQFEYMTLVEKLREDILKTHNLYMKNLRGDGYTFLPTEEQTEYAKNRTMEGIRKEMYRGMMIMRHVRFDALNAEQKRINADEMAKLGQLQHLLKVYK